MNGNQLPLGEYLRRAWSYRWVVFVPAVFAFAAATAFVTLQPDVYEAQVVFMTPLARTSGALVGASTEVQARDVVRSAREYLLGTRLLTRVMEELNPYPELQRREGPQAVLERLRRNLSVELNTGTGALNLVFRHREGAMPAQTAADVANRLADLFIEKQRDEIRDSATMAKAFLETEEAEYRTKLEAAEVALEDFRKRHQGALPEDIATNRNLILSFERQIDVYVDRQQRNRDEIERYKLLMLQIDTQLRGSAATATPRGIDSALDAIDGTLNQLEQERARMLRVYEEDSQQIRKIDEEIEACRARMERIRSDRKLERSEDVFRFMLDMHARRQRELEADIVRCDELQALARQKIAELEGKIAAAAALQSQYAALERNVRDASTRRELTRQRLQEAVFNVNRQKFDPATPVEVEQRAAVPAKPAGPDRLATALVGLALGVGVGVALVVLRRKLDVSYHEMLDLRALLPGTALVTVPEITKLTRRVPRLLLGAFCGLLLFAVFAGTLALLGLQVGWFDHPEMLEAVRRLR